MLYQKFLNSYFVFIIIFHIICISYSKNFRKGVSLSVKRPGKGSFRLVCRKNSFLSTFTSTYSERRHDKRRYKIECTQLPVKGNFGIQCQETSLSSRGTSFVKQCPDDYYMIGLSATKLYARDREFRIHCCNHDNIQLTACKNGSISERYMRFMKTFRNKDRVFTAMYSWYGKTFSDRKFMFTNCEMIPKTDSFKNWHNPFPTPPIIRSTNWNHVTRRITPPPIPVPQVTQGPPQDPTETNQETEEDFNIIVLPSKQDFDDERNENDISFLPGESRPFQSFDIKCPKGTGIKSIFVRKIAKNLKYDATFAINCDNLPHFIDPRREESQLLSFLIFKDGSVQSPCNFLNNQFLCGIKGAYDDRRGMEAHCCRVGASIDFVASAFAHSPTLEGAHLETTRGDPNQFIGNMDQIADGSFVGQIIAFKPQIRSRDLPIHQFAYDYD